MAVATETASSGAGGKFDESKVKRDKGGKFAKKEGRGGKDWAELLDGFWKMHAKDAGLLLMQNYGDKIQAALKDAAFKAGVPYEKYIAQDSKYKAEGQQIMVDTLNELAKKHAVSPSGEQRISFEWNKDKTDFTPRVVPNEGPNPHPQVTQRMKSDWTSMQRQNREWAKSDSSSGGIFNDAATLDTSRVSDTSDPGYTSPTSTGTSSSGTSWLDRIREMMHSDDSLAHETVDGVKVRTIQDILDEMSEDERAFHDLIVGAAIDDVDISENQELVLQYNALSDERKDLIDFVVGSVLTNEDEVRHSDVDNFLAHYGVKGMKWGVRRDDTSRPDPSSSTPLSKSNLNTKAGRSEARAKVKAGAATLGEAHVAALKSTGHRVTNALLGDKTYWKQQAIIAGVSLAAVGAAFAVPAVLPASTLAAVGAWAAGSHGVAGVVSINGQLITTSALGSQILTGIGLTATQIGSGVAGTYSSVANLGRAIRGNARINKSYAALVDRIGATQTAGTKRVNKILNQSGSIRKRNLQHSFDEVGNFLAHYGVKGMQWGVRNGVQTGARVNLSTIGEPVVSYGSKKVRKKDVQAVFGPTAQAASDLRDRLASDRAPIYRDLDKINSGKYAGKDILNDGPTREAYMKDVASILEKHAKSWAPPGSSVLVRVAGDSFDLYIGTGQFIADVAAMRHSDGMHIRMLPTRDANGFITGFEMEGGAMQQGAVARVGAFLEHYGIKGMKWGVRRAEGADGTVSGALKGKGGPRTSADPGFMSADAERFVETLRKQGHEMSDREMKEAIARAKKIEEYDQLFNNPNRDLQRKVEALRLQEEFNERNARLNPSKMAQVKSFLNKAEAGFDRYRALDEKYALTEQAKKMFSTKTGTTVSNLVDAADNVRATTGGVKALGNRFVPTPKPAPNPTPAEAMRTMLSRPAGPPSRTVAPGVTKISKGPKAPMSADEVKRQLGPSMNSGQAYKDFIEKYSN